ncbi:MAG: hypothetical protein M3Y44_11895 [Actinomycetota bacterium]|nr:hypothetical protein [Actinomycetota bacterium]
MSLFALGLMAASGYGVLRIAAGWRPYRRVGVLAAAGLSPLLGAAVIGLTTTCAGVLGLPTRPWPVIAPVVLVAAVTGVTPPSLLPWRRSRPDAPPPAAAEDSRRQLPTAFADGCVALTVAVVAAVLLVGVGHRTVCCNDEYAIWTIRARTLSLAGHLDPAVFAGAQANYQQQDYPLLQPGVIAWGDGLAGRLDDTAAHVLLAALLLGMLAFVGAALNRLAGPLSGVCGVLLICGTAGVLTPFGLLLTADIPLAAFSVAAVFALASWVVRRDRFWLVLGTVLAAGAAATKVEGALFALAALAAAAIAAPQIPRARRDAALAVGAVLLSMVPWNVWTRAHHIRSDLINSDTLTLSHLRKVAPYAGDIARLIVRYWPGYGWLMAAAAALAALLAVAELRARRLVAFVSAAWALGVVGMWAQYWVSAGRDTTGDAIAREADSHFASSAPRVLIVPSLLLSLAVPLLAGALIRAGRPAQRERSAAKSDSNAQVSASRQDGSGVSPAASQRAAESTE